MRDDSAVEGPPSRGTPATRRLAAARRLRLGTCAADAVRRSAIDGGVGPGQRAIWRGHLSEDVISSEAPNVMGVILTVDKENWVTGNGF